jgi:hypothetical protein
MMLQEFWKIDNIIKNYTEAYMIGNGTDLSVQLIAHVSEDDKERILNDLDLTLPYGLIFNHEYENGKLKINFKEVAQ